MARTPPRYVPTLTEVVKAEPARAPVAARARGGPGPSQDQVIQRVMQRVDLMLERKLREAIAAAVLEQTRAIAPLLRDEIEAVVRETVAQAFADEHAQPPRR